MSKLVDVLNRYRTPIRIVYGPSETTPSPALPPFDRESFRQDLQTVRAANEKYFRVGIALLAILFVALLVVIVLSLDKPERLQWVGAGFGGSQLVVLAFFRSWWKERSQADLLLSILPYLPDASLRQVVDRLWETIMGGDAGKGADNATKSDPPHVTAG